ncbi:MAG TPA: glycosyltransferase family 39 protein [Acidimicrobiales bacterium]|nr:glycosyltransferase family 39 protein [Acidimicrobiales bacterium]
MERSATARVVAVAVGLAGVVAGQVVLAREGPTVVASVLVLAGLVGVVWPAGLEIDRLDPPVPPTSPTSFVAPTSSGRTGRDGPGLPMLAVAGLANCAYAAGAAFHRGHDRATYDITVAWAVGLSLFCVAGCAGRSPRRRLARSFRQVRSALVGRRRPTAPVVAGVVVAMVGLVARLALPGRFPALLDSDEGFFLIEARMARQGDLPNPYGTAVWGIPRLYLAVQGVVSRPFADQYQSYRLVGALIGAATVLATWRAGRRIVGEGAALAGAAILALLPFHLWASRVSLNNAVNGLTLMLAVLCTGRLVHGRRRADAMALGLTLGLGLFGYFPAATYPLVVAGGLAVSAAMTAVATGSVRRPGGAAVRDLGRLAAWVVGGWFVGAAPLLGHYAGYPDGFLGRTRLVTEGAGSPGVGTRLGWVPRGVLYPVLGQPGAPIGHFFRHAAPFVGWVVALLVLVGLGLWGRWLVAGARGIGDRRRVELLVVGWLVAGVGVSQSKDMASQRLVGVAPLWTLVAGCGVVALVAVVRMLLGAARAARFQPLVAGLAVLGLVALGVGGARFWFDDARQIVTYSDVRSVAAYDLGERLAGRGPALGRVLLAGEGALSYQGFGNVRFLAPGLEAMVLEVPAFQPGDGSPQGVPELEAGDVLVLYVERPDAERCAVQARHPDAVVHEARTQAGDLLYTAYHRDGPGLPGGSTPAGTILLPVAPAPCG